MVLNYMITLLIFPTGNTHFSVLGAQQRSGAGIQYFCYPHCSESGPFCYPHCSESGPPSSSVHTLFKLYFTEQRIFIYLWDSLLSSMV